MESSLVIDNTQMNEISIVWDLSKGVGADMLRPMIRWWSRYDKNFGLESEILVTYI
jgi:hypothetical protein